MKFSQLGLAALTLSLTQLLSGQSDQSQPSTYKPTTPSAQPAPAGTAAASPAKGGAEKQAKDQPANPAATPAVAATNPNQTPPNAANQPGQPQAATSASGKTTAPAQSPGQNVASQSPAQPPAQAQAQPAIPASASAANNTASNNQNAPRVQIDLAPKDAKAHSAEKFVGHHIRDSEGRDLGKLKDFLIDGQTGQADFALISSSGLAGIGDKLRLVPVDALQANGQKNEFSLDIHEDQWKQLLPLNDHAFDSGQFTLSDSQRRQIAQNFEHRTDAPKDSGFFSASLTSHLVRASNLAGREVHATDGRLGKIDAVVLDLSARRAQALIAPNHDFTGMEEKLLVPFQALSIGANANDTHPQPLVSSLLSRADFQTPKTGNQMATGTQPAAGQPTGAATAVASAAAPANAQPAQPGNAAAKGANAAQNQNVAANASTQSPAPSAPSASGQQVAANGKASQNQSGNGGAAVAANDKSTASNPGKQQPNPATSTAANQPASRQPDATRVAANEKSPSNQNTNLSPTGQTSADSIPAGTDPALLAASRAIRKALDNDRALASTDVQVTPEDGKIVLRGRVSDQKTKTAIIEKATHELKGWKINDQISVDTR